jgi:hypothetical protein
MDLEKDFLQYLESTIHNINISELYENIKLNSLINRVLLIQLVEALYYRHLIEHKEMNNNLLGFLQLLKSDEADNISEITYLYIIYFCDKIMKQSQNHMYI